MRTLQLDGAESTLSLHADPCRLSILYYLKAAFNKLYSVRFSILDCNTAENFSYFDTRFIMIFITRN